jgi:hypothetical protein
VAREIEFADGGTGKIRSFWVGLLLILITFGIYYYFWYYLVNDELKDIGVSLGDQKLAESSPGSSVIAVLIGSLVVIPGLLSVYNYGQRIKRAQGVAGVPAAERINPVLAFLLVFPFGALVIPALVHYWYVTKHQNIAVRAAAR